MENKEFLIEEFSYIAALSGATIFNRKGHKMVMTSFCNECKDDSKLSLFDDVTKEQHVYSIQGKMKGDIDSISDHDLVLRFIMEEYYVPTVIYENKEQDVFAFIPASSLNNRNAFIEFSEAVQNMTQENIDANARKGISKVIFKRYI
jgi:hypothetical protein